MNRILRCAFWAIGLGALLSFTRPLSAADTVETWDVGATDVDFYVGLDGVGLGENEKTIYGDMMLGYGLIERFSAYFGATLESNEFFSAGMANLYLGIFGTPLETDHFDLDLFLDISAGGAGFEEFALSPALEMNFDLDPEMRTWGLYLRTPFPITGRKLNTSEHQESEDFETTFRLEATVGTYVTIADIHQILLEYDMGYHPAPEEDERELDVGGLALGYNVVVTEPLELITQVVFDLPQDDETFSVGFMLGLIATLP